MQQSYFVLCQFKSRLINMCGRTLSVKIPVSHCHSATCHVGKTGRTCPVCQTGLFAAGQDILAARQHRHSSWQSGRLLSSNQDKNTNRHTELTFRVSVYHVLYIGYFRPVKAPSDHQSGQVYWPRYLLSWLINILTLGQDKYLGGTNIVTFTRRYNLIVILDRYYDFKDNIGILIVK